MAIRIAGVDIPQNKRGEIALTYIYGIGRSSANQILEKAGVDKDVKVKDWTDDMAAAVREVIGAEFKVEGDLPMKTRASRVHSPLFGRRPRVRR